MLVLLNVEEYVFEVCVVPTPSLTMQISQPRLMMPAPGLSVVMETS